MGPRATDRMVRAGGVRLFARWIEPAAGRGPGGTALVMLHHGLGSVSQWRGFPADLAAATGLGALVYDRLGYGRSEGARGPRGIDYVHHQAHAVLPEMLATFGVDRPILVGHSEGGSIALLYAARFPGRAAGVVVEAAHVFVEDVNLAHMRRVRRAYRRGPFRRRLARHHGAGTDAMFAAWYDTWQDPAFSGWDIRRELPQVTCPTLAIFGAKDPYVTPAHLDAIIAGVSGPATPLLLPCCGHAPHRDAPAQTLAAMTTLVAAAVAPTRWPPRTHGAGPRRPPGPLCS